MTNPVLVDTNILIGSLLSPTLVIPEIQQIIRESSRRCFSVVSLWEIVHLQQKNRITLDLPVNSIMRQAERDMDMELSLIHI